MQVKAQMREPFLLQTLEDRLEGGPFLGDEKDFLAASSKLTDSGSRWFGSSQSQGVPR
jgi:hypothetical protein